MYVCLSVYTSLKLSQNTFSNIFLYFHKFVETPVNLNHFNTLITILSSRNLRMRMPTEATNFQLCLTEPNIIFCKLYVLKVVLRLKVKGSVSYNIILPSLHLWIFIRIFGNMNLILTTCVKSVRIVSCNYKCKKKCFFDKVMKI